MEWHDEGIILGTRRHGETSAILEVMTPAHGRHLGLVRGGRSRRMQPLLQPGNRVALVWRARLDEHLGTFQVEPLEANAARLLSSATGVYGVQMLASHLRLLPERDPHQGLFETLSLVIAHLDDASVAGPLVARFEVAILEALGFGLDLSRCAVTGSRENLAFVSPKTGRAVTGEAGEPWRDKLLPLPAFLTGPFTATSDGTRMAEAFALTGHFLHRHVYEPRGMKEPETRAGFLGALRRSAGGDAQRAS